MKSGSYRLAGLVFYVILLGLILFHGGCSPDAEEKREIKKIIFLGDSITAGQELDDQSNNYAVLVSKELFPNAEWMNLAVSGATTSDVLRDQLPRVQEFKADLVLLFIGANDATSNTPQSAFVMDYKEVVQKIVEKDALLIIGDVPNILDTPMFKSEEYLASRAVVSLALDRINAAIKQIAKKNRIPLVEFHKNPASRDSSVYSEDGYHPNAKGHRIIADEFEKVIKRDIRA